MSDEQGSGSVRGERMTKEEALKAMRTFNHLLEGGDIGPDVTCGDVVEATRVAINALESKSEAEEYRTPKKVEVRHIKETNCDIYFCSTCHAELGEFWPKYEEVPSYCFYCGQALDWSEVKE